MAKFFLIVSLKLTSMHYLRFDVFLHVKAASWFQRFLSLQCFPSLRRRGHIECDQAFFNLSPSSSLQFFILVSPAKRGTQGVVVVVGSSGWFGRGLSDFGLDRRDLLLNDIYSSRHSSRFSSRTFLGNVTFVSPYSYITTISPLQQPEPSHWRRKFRFAAGGAPKH